MILGLTYLDVAVIIVYFLVLIVIGFWAMRRIKDEEDYFLGGRRFGKIIQMFAAFGQATSADTGPSVATTTANNGAAGIWSALMMLFSTPSYWFTAVWYRRLRLLTMGDYFRERFASRWLGGIYSILASISLMLLLTVGFIAITKTVMVMTPKSQEDLTPKEKLEYKQATRLEELDSRDYKLLDPEEKQELEQLRILKPRKNFSYIDKPVLILAIVVIVCIYAVAGGLEAAFISDMMQGIFIILLSLLLIPFAFIRINETYGSTGIMGAFRTLHDQLPESFFEIFGSPYALDFTWYYIVTLGIMATLNVAVGANQLVATASAKNEFNARFGFTYGTYLKRITTIFWGLTALAAVLLFGEQVTDPDHLWGYASRELLTPLNLGLIGLMIAALMAALMSTADMMMITASGLLTSGVYRPLFPGKPEKHYVGVGRLMGVLIVIGAALIVLESESLFAQLKFMWEFAVIYAAGFWTGITWRRTNRKAVWSSISATFVLFFFLPLILPVIFPGMRTHPYLLKRTEQRIEERVYTARFVDVEERNATIARWDELYAIGQAQGPRPDSLHGGQEFTKAYKLPSKSVFWTGGVIRERNNQPVGRGMISLELVLLDLAGFNLEKNVYALNETLRILIRTLFPFLIIILVSLLTRHKPDEQRILDPFYLKLKTPVQPTAEEDEKELERVYRDPGRYDHRKMFPGTQWELMTWNRQDTYGFLIALGFVGLILGLLYLTVSIGKF